MDKETLNKQATNLDEFCRKYIEYFKSLKREPPEDRYCFIESPVFVQECKSLGFEMDCGESFIERYGADAWNNEEDLNRIIDRVSDVKVIGSGIFSKWRFYNHWCESSEELYNGIGWFKLVFDRLLKCAENVENTHHSERVQ